MSVGEIDIYPVGADEVPRLRISMGINAPPKIVTGVYGGWRTISKARGTGMLEFAGNDPVSMDIPLLFDAYLKPGRDVEGDIARLEALARRPVMSGGIVAPQPGPIWIYGAIPSSEDFQWVILDLVWGDEVEFNEFGLRRRQDVVMRVQHYDPEVVQFADLSTPTHASTVYIVKKGDTLRSIAAAKLGSAKKWKALAKLNGIRDGGHLKPGQHLRLR